MIKALLICQNVLFVYVNLFGFKVQPMSNSTLYITGAVVSEESGITTFRGSDGCDSRKRKL